MFLVALLGIDGWAVRQSRRTGNNRFPLAAARRCRRRLDSIDPVLPKQPFTHLEYVLHQVLEVLRRFRVVRAPREAMSTPSACAATERRMPARAWRPDAARQGRVGRQRR